MLCSNTFTTRNRLTSGATETASLLLQNRGLLLYHFYTRGLPGFKALSQTTLSWAVSQSHHLKDVPQPVVVLRSSLLLHHDQHEKCPSCLLPPQPFKHQNKNRGRKQKKCTRGGRRPSGEECVWRVGGPPPDSPTGCSAFFLGGLQQVEDGKGGSSSHTHTLRHTLVCIFSHD